MSKQPIELQNLCFSYPDGTEALCGISFQINYGESVAIVGGNGAGKSTLLQHLNGYLRPMSGTVLVRTTDQSGNPCCSPAFCGCGVSGSGRSAFYADRF